mgnify:CR=1 FL=1
MNKLIRGVCTFAAAVALIAAPLAAGSAAVADEVTDPAVVQTVEETAPATDTTEAPAEVAEATVVTEPEVVTTTPAEQPVQEPVDNAVQTTDAQPQAPPVAVKSNPYFESYEVCATWSVDKGNDLWPQTLVSRDCNYVPAAQCEPYKIQFDKYWIRDEADKAYWESLTKLNSAADDQRLEPHGYYVKTIEARDCSPKPINPIANGEVVCGAATFNLYNPARAEGDVNLTASLVFWIDGKVAPEHIYAVASGEVKTVTVSFPEDSGNHSIFVRTGYAQGDEYVWDQVVTTDCIPPKPDNKVTFTEWKTGEFACGDTTVQITREATSTEYILVEGAWVPEGASVTTTQTETRDLTKAEIDSLECTVVVPPKPPVTETPKPTTPPAPETGNLAATGADGGSILGWSLVAFGIIAGAIALIVTGRRKAQAIPVKSETDEV